MLLTRYNMKSLILIIAAVFVSIDIHSQHIQMQQLGAFGGILESSGSSFSLIHSMGAIAGTTILEGNSRLDQGMFLACDISCDGFKVSISGTDEDLIPKISIYPNPTDGLLYLDGKDHLIQRFEVYTYTGQRLSYGALTGKLITLEDFPKGIYLIRIFGNKNELSLEAKIVKQ